MQLSSRPRWVCAKLNQHAPAAAHLACSFPSGHTSTVFVYSVWTAAYCTWALSMR